MVLSKIKSSKKAQAAKGFLEKNVPIPAHFYAGKTDEDLMAPKRASPPEVNLLFFYLLLRMRSLIRASPDDSPPVPSHDSFAQRSSYPSSWCSTSSSSPRSPASWRFTPCPARTSRRYPSSPTTISVRPFPPRDTNRVLASVPFADPIHTRRWRGLQLHPAHRRYGLRLAIQLRYLQGADGERSPPLKSKSTFFSIQPSDPDPTD